MFTACCIPRPSIASRREVSLLRFFRTPKGILTILLAILVALAAPAAGIVTAWRSVLVAAAAGMLVDAPILRRREGAWTFPSGALLTGALVAMVLSADEPPHVVAITSAAGVASKYLFRTRTANVFNPAALALIGTFHVFDTAQNWWGALPELPPYMVTVVFATGIFMTIRVNKMPMVLAFLGVYYAAFTATAFASDPAGVAEIFRAPDLHMALFFSFFILTDPPTSPTKYRDQIICGAIVAVVSFGVFEWLGAAYYLLAGVLAGNLWETARRLRVRRGRQRAIT
ncbi:MAG TPA: RnfABCDGE type electron transport complex subunit D [Vicinamibacterales bacterium]|nr:RnfABCDGE type electron transport complex subunit D [Vicinamibacterales bacterium]